MILNRRAASAGSHVLAALVVYLKETGLAARLDSHICNRQTSLNREVLNRRAAELHSAIQGAINTDFANDMQDDVLCRGTRRELAIDLKANGLGHLEPGTARCHAHAGVGGAHAG